MCVCVEEADIHVFMTKATPASLIHFLRNYKFTQTAADELRLERAQTHRVPRATSKANIDSARAARRANNP